MTMLFPWFALAGVAIAAPIIMHLIRRDIRGERVFSTLRFLTPAVPPPTQKRKLENLLLLLARAAILILLAIMFTRPFLKNPEASQTAQVSRRIAILVDVSASMSLNDRLTRARELVSRIVADSSSTDRIQVFSAGRNTQLVAGDWNNPEAVPLKSDDVIASIRGSLEQESLSDAVQTILALHESSQKDSASGPLPLTVHVISDFATEFNPAWQRIDWPAQSLVELHPVEEAPAETSPWLELLEPEPSALPTVLKVRVTNGRDSKTEQLELQLDEQAFGQPLVVGRGRSLSVDVPLSEKPQVLQLVGSSHAGSAVVLPPTQTKPIVVGCWTNEAGDSDWILEQALASNDSLSIDWTRLDLSSDLDEVRADALFILSPPPLETLPFWRKHLEQGRPIIVSLLGPTSTDAIASWETFFGELLPDRSVQFGSPESEEFRLIQGVRNPLTETEASGYLATFDFGETRIFESLTMSWTDNTGVSLGELDDGRSWLARFDEGPGRVFVINTGWTAAHSQLARSSRFPILMSTLAGLSQQSSSYDVESIGSPLGEAELVVANPLSIEASSDAADLLSIPGLYQRESDASESSSETQAPWLVAQVALSEWRFNDGAYREIQAAGLPQANSVNQREDQARAVRARVADEQLEQSQQIWRWTLMGVGGLLAFEAWAAWRAVARPGSENA